MITCTFEDGGQAPLRHAVVDVVVFKEGKILLVKRAQHMVDGGKWALVGGFVDRDETIEQAAEREVFEETGWRVEKLTRVAVLDSPDRALDRQDISFVYTCQAVVQEGEPDDESEEVSWFTMAELPPKSEMAFDHYETLQSILTTRG